MARRKQSPFEDLIETASKLPWWLDLVLALVAYVWLHSIAEQEVTVSAQPGQIGAFVGHTIFNTLATLGQYLLPFAFLLGAGMSAFGRFKRSALHQQVASSPDRASLDRMSWQEFEALVGEAFRRRGFTVSETGGGGPDGGIDLALRKDNETFLVQCKQWKAYKVGVDVVRELYGVMAAKSATGGFVVTSGAFTEEAGGFAIGRNIELMDGKALHALIRGVNVPANSSYATQATASSITPTCPICQSAMTKRVAKRGSNSGNEFWGCTRYPACKGTRAI
jgi:restriction system protein